MELEEVRKLKLEPGEILVIRYSEDKTNSFLSAVSEQFKRYMPNIKVLVIAGAAEIAVITEEQTEKVKRKYNKH